MEKFVTKIALIIFEVNQKDFGTYKCVAKNPLGVSDGTINLTGKNFSNVAVSRVT